MLKKVGGKYMVLSKSGKKKLSKLLSLKRAKKRLQQIEFFKHKENK